MSLRILCECPMILLEEKRIHIHYTAQRTLNQYFIGEKLAEVKIDLNGTLKTYKRIRVFRPNEPNIRRWVLPEERRIYINTAAPDGKIVELRFGKEKENG